MAKSKKKKSGKGKSAWNRTFGRISQECFANVVAQEGDMSDYGTCMRSQLRSASKKRKK